MIFAPAFQPIKDVGTGSFVAAEVLARWYDEGRVLTPSSLSSPPYWGLVDMEMARFIQDNLHYCLDLYPALFLNVSEHTLQSDVIFKAWWRRGAPPNYLECIMEKHNLKSGFSIYFADVHFEKQVYAFGSGLGFTSVIYAYSLGRDPEEAEKLALEKYDSDETKVKKVHVNLARSQDINRYTFPEQMAGFANAIQSHGIAVN